jgi:hypothetical protein
MQEGTVVSSLDASGDIVTDVCGVIASELNTVHATLRQKKIIVGALANKTTLVNGSFLYKFI